MAVARAFATSVCPSSLQKKGVCRLPVDNEGHPKDGVDSIETVMLPVDSIDGNGCRSVKMKQQY
jgi:hypothetical protein